MEYLSDQEIQEIREEVQTLLGLIQKFLWKVQAELFMDKAEIEALLTWMGKMGWEVNRKPNAMIELNKLLRKFAEDRRLPNGHVNDGKGESDEGDQSRYPGT